MSGWVLTALFLLLEIFDSLFPTQGLLVTAWLLFNMADTSFSALPDFEQDI